MSDVRFHKSSHLHKKVSDFYLYHVAQNFGRANFGG